MKNLFLLILINSFLIFSISQCGLSNSKGDLTTPAAILNHLKKEHTDLDENDICIDEIDGFTELFIVGYFANDRGCGSPDYYFEGKEITLGKRTIQKILMNGNFEEDNLAAVEAFHMGVTNHYNYSMNTISANFDTTQYAFSPPKTFLNKDIITSEIWIQEQGGMLQEVTFHLSTLTVMLDGTLADHQISNRYTVQY